jgi:predicted Zn-dependent peptidase
MRPSLREEDFNIEKNVIKEEIAMYKDLPQFDVVERCRAAHFDKHPCGNSVLGTVESIDALTAAQMKQYFQLRYAPNNLIVACAGNFDFDRLCDCIEKRCSRWQPKQTARTRQYFAGTFKKNRLTKPNLVREHICLISPAVAWQDERAYAATLLAMIVGDDTGSRFFWELVDTALAETASMHCEAMDGIGIFYSLIRTGSENADKVLNIVENIFASLGKNGVTEQELQKAKNKLLSNIAIKNEVPFGRLVELGFNWVYLNEYRPIDDEIRQIKKITTADLHSLIMEYPLDCFTRFSLTPSK